MAPIPTGPRAWPPPSFPVKKIARYTISVVQSAGSDCLTLLHMTHWQAMWVAGRLLAHTDTTKECDLHAIFQGVKGL